MFVRWLLFETRLGLALLALLERTVGLAIVDADWLCLQPSGVPTTQSEGQ